MKGTAVARPIAELPVIWIEGEAYVNRTDLHAVLSSHGLDVERARRAFRSMMDRGLISGFIHDDQYADVFAKAYAEAGE